MNFVIFDTEFTTWKGCNENGWHDWQKQEIVQLGALKINGNTLEVIEELDLLIKPTINPVLSDYFINLVGINNEDIKEKGTSFPIAYEKFYNFAKGLPCFSHGWSRNPADFVNPSQIMLWSDGKIVHDNLELNNQKEDTPLDYKNIAFWFKKMYEKYGINVECQASGEIVKILGVEKNIENLGLNIHNALFDVYSILEGVRYFKAENLMETYS